jgi:hypothetical protein
MTSSDLIAVSIALVTYFMFQIIVGGGSLP